MCKEFWLRCDLTWDLGVGEGVRWVETRLCLEEMLIVFRLAFIFSALGIHHFDLIGWSRKSLASAVSLDPIATSFVLYLNLITTSFLLQPTPELPRIR